MRSSHYIIAWAVATVACGPQLRHGVPVYVVAYVDYARPEVWRVGASGLSARIDVQLPCGSAGMLGYGSTRPQPSPTGRWVAFGLDGDIWLHDLTTGTTSRVTSLGHYGQDIDPVVALIHSWSGDGKRLLFSHAQFMPRTPPLPNPRSSYHILDADTRRITQQPMPFEIMTWLSTGDFILSADPHSKELYVMRRGATRPQRIPLENGMYGQLSPSHRGARALAVYSPDGTASRVVAFEPKGTWVPVTEPGPWAKYQWPTFSPSDARIAYIQQDSMVLGRPVQALVVDGTRAFECSGPIPNYRWINDSTLVVNCERSLVVVDPALSQPREVIDLYPSPCE